MAAAARGASRGSRAGSWCRSGASRLASTADTSGAPGELPREGGVRLDLEHVEEVVAAERGARTAEALDERRLRRRGVRAQRLVDEPAALGPVPDRGGARQVGLLAQDDEDGGARAGRPAGEDPWIDLRSGGFVGTNEGEEEEKARHAGITAQPQGGIILLAARVAELADARDLGSRGVTPLRVQIPPLAPSPPGGASPAPTAPNQKAPVPSPSASPCPSSTGRRTA